MDVDYISNMIVNLIDNLARKTSMADNNDDCIKVLYLASKQVIRQNIPQSKKRKKSDEITEKIN